MREGDWKLIDYFGDAFDCDSAGGATYRPGARLELFNLRRDPGEQHNVASADPRRAARMQRQLREWVVASADSWRQSAVRGHAPVRRNPRQARRLRALASVAWLEAHQRIALQHVAPTQLLQ